MKEALKNNVCSDYEYESDIDTLTIWNKDGGGYIELCFSGSEFYSFVVDNADYVSDIYKDHIRICFSVYTMDPNKEKGDEEAFKELVIKYSENKTGYVYDYVPWNADENTMVK